MAAIFLVLLYNSPSGLVLYWTLNNVFSLFKNIYYKTGYKHKFGVLMLFFSTACVFLAVYIIVIYKGNLNLRLLLTGMFLAVGCIPWIISPIKKIIAFFPKIKLPEIKSPIDFFISFFALWILTVFFLPSSLIASSPSEFSYIDAYTTPLYFIANTATQSFGLFVFWVLCLYFLFPQKIKNAFTIGAPILFIFALCNVFLFTGNYGIISVNLVYDSSIGHNWPEIMLNVAALLVISLFIPVLYFFNKQRFITIGALLSLIGLSAYNIFSIQKSYRASEEYHTGGAPELTEVSPVFNLSRTGKNTIVIMLDRAISVFLPYIFEESPELHSIYKGFIYYPNTVSFNGYTRMGAPPLFGGYEYTPREINSRNQVPIVTKHNEALLMLPRIFFEAGYLVTVTDPPYPNYSYREDLRIYDQYPGIKALITDSVYTKLWIKEHDLDFPSTGDILKRNLLWYSMFKISPLAFRQGIYLQGDWCAPASSQKMTLTLNGYSVLDYLPKLTGIVDDSINTALIMVNNTTHETSFLQAPEYRPALHITNYGSSPFGKEMAYHINAAAIKRLAEWFEYLKEQNLYDNSRIILVSDHGPLPNFVVKTGLPFNVEQFNPLLLVKDFNAEGNLRTDRAFMSNADVPYLALKDQIEKPINPFTGKEINIEAKKSPLYIAVSGSIQMEDPMASTFTLNPQKDYYVLDNIFDPANWKKAEK
ncbi:MAG: hypothetical protein LBC51_00485 [Treponema sp.]|nr:hypothetical protein [Treponema sp.]